MTNPTVTSTAVMPIVRVAVLAQTRLTEVALPAELPLREILPALQSLLAVDADDADHADAAPLSLAPIGGGPFSLDTTLDTVGVVDGDLLALQPVPPGPAAPGIVEDIADAAALFSAPRFRPWGSEYLERGARIATATAILIITAAAVTHWTATAESVGRYALGGLALVAMVAALVASARAPRAAVDMAIVALAPIAAALALAFPDAVGAPQVVLAAAGVTAWSLIAIIVIRRAIGFFTCSTVVGAGVGLAAAAEAVWRLPTISLGCGLVVAGLLITVSAAQLAALWARFPLPVIPAPGDPTPSAPSLRILQDLPRRVRLADSHQTGFIAAGVLLGVLGSLAVVGRPVPPETSVGWAWYLVVAAAAAATLRARVWDSAPCKAWLLAHSYLLSLVLLVAFIATERYVAAFWALVVLAALAGAWVVAATNPRIADSETYSLPMRRLVGFAAAGLDASLIPVVAYLVGVFFWVLNR